MKQLYLDLFSGISGDMFVGALLDLGVDAHTLEKELRKLQIQGYHIHVTRASKQGISGTKFDVHVTQGHSHQHEHTTTDSRLHSHSHPHTHTHAHEHAHSSEAEPDHPHAHHPGHGHSHEHAHSHEHTHEAPHHHGRSFRQIQDLIATSSLSDWVKSKSIAIFGRIAVAEGKVHGLPPEDVEFHEVGAVDSIVDIVGTCVALELLGKPRVFASRVTEGSGWVDCAHGRFPVPTPATLEIFAARGIPVSQCDEPHELVTPTGAALVAELAESFGPMQGLAVERVGVGLGTRNNLSRPNVLRVTLGPVSAAGDNYDWETDSVTVLETNLDDISPEVLGFLIEKALAGGALDVWHTSIQMKKNRPGVLLSLLCAEADADRFTVFILTETSAFGVRRHTTERRKLLRTSLTVDTQYGPILVKTGKLNGNLVQAAPEFEACRRAAEQHNVPLKQIYAAAVKALPTAPKADRS